MTSHDFKFNGGDILRHMAASWFVSYAYYEYIDNNHINWSNVQSAPVRVTKYLSSRDYHKYWLEKISSMNDSKLNINQLGLTASQVKQMAAEVLKVI